MKYTRYVDPRHGPTIIPADECRRGPKSAYQKWADQVGDQSFTFDNLLPYFEKSATFTPPNYSKINLLPGDNITYDPSVFSSNGGPLQLSYSNYRQQISRGINSGMETLGLESVDGFCSGELLGFSTLLLTVDPADEIRSSSETSFLQSAVTNGADMKIYNNTLAKRIVFDSGKVAKGVIVNSLGGDYLLSATKEVIVSAGAVGVTYSHCGTRADPYHVLVQISSALDDLRYRSRSYA